MAKKVLVIGAARSGLAATCFLVKQGYEVVLTDMKKITDEEILSKLAKERVTTIWEQQPDVRAIQPDLIVISPGIPLTIPPAVIAKQMGIPIINETELAYCSAKASFVAITGTNGKTTTTTLIGELLHGDDRQVVVGGNIGVPLVSVAESLAEDDLIVAEMSSFQLETIDTFRPKVAVMLNLTPDHLDRHGNIAGYLQAKSRIFRNQTAEDYLVLNYDDSYLAPLAVQAQSKVIFFSRKNTLEEGVCLDGDAIVFKESGRSTIICSRREIALKGAHNLENAMAAIAAVYVLGVSPEHIRRVLREFKGVEHRLESVRQWRGVLFVNDSKGTNPDSTIKALEAYDEPIILIAGGKNKGSDFTQLAQLILQRTKAVILVGQAAPEIRAILEQVGYKNIVAAQNYEEVVRQATTLAEHGDVVLLSPACASWDMFTSYEERGDLFKKLVNDLAE